MQRAIATAIAVVGLALSGAALADCNGAFVNDCQNATTNNEGGTGIGVGIAGAQAGAHAGAVAGASADVDIRNAVTGFQFTEQHQKQLQGNIGLGSGNRTAIQIDAPIIPSKTEATVRNTPNASAPNIYPTAPCMGSSSAGGSGAGFGFSLGTSWKDDDCGLRETARLFDQLGHKADGLAVLCSSSYAKAAPACAPKPMPAKAADNGGRSEPERKADATVKASVGNGGAPWYAANPAILGR